MLIHKSAKANLFNSQAQVLVNPVNTIGVMGAGLALQFKRRYPTVFNAYKARCHQVGAQKLAPGKLQFVPTGIDEHWVLNFPTKAHYKDPSKLEYIEVGLNNLAHVCVSQHIDSIALPKIGAGLGGLDWNHQVLPLVEHYLAPLDTRIEVFDA